MNSDFHKQSLASHDRYDYSAIVDRPGFEWPGGKGLAVYIAVNLEHFPFGTGMGHALAPPQPEPDVMNYAWRDYGNRVGIWRLLEEFDRFQLPFAGLLNTALIEYAPSLIDALKRASCEIVGHGRSNGERQSQWDEPTERSMIEAVTRDLTETFGQAPAGWMGPWVAESRVTPDLLAEVGYRYVMDWGMDDQPVWLRTRDGGRMLSIPYPRPSNDIALLHGHHMTPRAYTEILIDQFDEMLDQSASAPLVFNLSLHPFLVGQPFRLRALRVFFEYMASRRDEIWLTTPGEICRHVESLEAGSCPDSDE
ncbi:MAG: polysaccharide deacetylase family protein [Verrucomicrobiota bacterium]